MEAKLDKKYDRLSLRSLMLYELAKRRAERVHQAMDLRGAGLAGNASPTADSGETDRSGGLGHRH